MSYNFPERLSKLYNSGNLPWIIISAGILLRLIRYLYNPSLWFDESRNAINILNRSLLGIIPPPPDVTVSPPIGFFLLEKIAIFLFGTTEYALRLFPLLFGVVSLFLFYIVARHYIKPKSVPIAIGLFAVLNPLVELSSELKPYTGDVAITLLLYVSTIYSQTKKTNAWQIIFLGGLGAVMLWFSHPSVFILSAIGITLSVSCMVNKEWAKMRGLFITFLIWGISFLAVYFVYTGPLSFNFTLTNDRIVWMNHKAFMPCPPLSLSDFQWFLDLPQRIFAFPVGLTFTGIGALTFIAGCITIFTKNKEHFFILFTPLIITLLASGFHKYVFSREPILFLVPLIVIIIAEGTEYIIEKLNQSSRIIGIIFLALLFVHPLSWSAYYAVKPISHEEIKPVLAHIKNNWQSGDIIYVYYMSQFAFEYYSKYYPGNYHFNDNQYIIGHGPQDWYATYKRQEFKGFWNPEKPFSQPFTEILKEYVQNINELKGYKRVWVLFSSIVSKEGINEEKFLKYHLDTIGKQLNFFGYPGVSAVYLYDLS